MPTRYLRLLLRSSGVDPESAIDLVRIAKFRRSYSGSIMEIRRSQKLLGVEPESTANFATAWNHDLRSVFPGQLIYTRGLTATHYRVKVGHNLGKQNFSP